MGIGVDLVLNITNQLLRPVILTFDQADQFSLDAQDEGGLQVTLFGPSTTLEWEIVKSTTNTGVPIGDEMGATFTVDGSSSTWNLTIDNIVKISGVDQRYFFPTIDNNTTVDLLMAVNWDLQVENRCNCVVEANGLSNIGYYLLYSNTVVVAFNASSGYTGNYTGWQNFNTGVSNPTGAITLTATTAPGGQTSFITPPGLSSQAAAPQKSDVEDAVVKIEKLPLKQAVVIDQVNGVSIRKR